MDIIRRRWFLVAYILAPEFRWPYRNPFAPGEVGHLSWRADRHFENRQDRIGARCSVDARSMMLLGLPPKTAAKWDRPDSGPRLLALAALRPRNIKASFSSPVLRLVFRSFGRKYCAHCRDNWPQSNVAMRGLKVRSGALRRRSTCAGASRRSASNPNQDSRIVARFLIYQDRSPSTWASERKTRQQRLGPADRRGHRPVRNLTGSGRSNSRMSQEGLAYGSRDSRLAVRLTILR